MKKYIITLLFLLKVFVIFSQDTTIHSDTLKKYYIGSKSCECYHFSVDNNTDDSSICWFTKDQKQNMVESFYEYFFKLKGSFSLYNIITEYGSTLFFDKDSPYIIFETFYKILSPHSSFHVFVIKRDGQFLSNKFNINILSAKSIKEKYKFENIDDFRMLSYNSDFIVIDESAL
jgi:hypothetical protein